MGDPVFLQGRSASVGYSVTETAEDIVTLADKEEGPLPLVWPTWETQSRKEPGARIRTVDGEKEGGSRSKSGPPPRSILLQDFPQGVLHMCFGTNKAILLDLGGVDIRDGA